MEENQETKVEKKEETNSSEESKPLRKKVEDLKKIALDNLRGRVIIFNPEKSEFAQKLNLKEKAEYIQKQK